MRGSEKSRRVTWASDVNLCQVRLFLTEESPSQVGGVTGQDHLQAKASWVSHSTGTASDDVLPPGFELAQSSNQSQIKASDVPVIKWRSPPRFTMDAQWIVVAGEESQDVEAQNQREMRVLEAVYPRPSAIPTNPAFPGETDSHHNDDHVLLIPIAVIEDEDSSDIVGTMSAQQPQSSSAPGVAPQFASTAAEPDVVAAASAAFAAINRSNEQGSLIDHDLLIKILSNPKLIEKLVKDHGASAAATTSAVQNSKQPFIASSEPFYGHANMGGRTIPPGPNVHAAPPPGPFMNIPPPVVATSASSGGPPPSMKDFSYYKNLIQQHGGERQPDRYGGQQQPQHQQHRQQQDQLGYSKSSKDSKTKIMKPCLYFNSSRGCRNGANCAFQHDNAAPPQPRGSSMASSEMQSSKRMKMDREISS
ncbi:unnamed protein product [Linum tenue]|uniref:C3H1-type domain-containing protein n=1 Tax=Linum tenue TaxID=586396 RepID=A0AAV0LNU0_9ROSI|nr:unnamed protein product [Linum tenue]